MRRGMGGRGGALGEVRANLREDGEGVGFLGFREEGEGDFDGRVVAFLRVVGYCVVYQRADWGLGAREPGGADS